jgi:hypothetical protein
MEKLLSCIGDNISAFGGAVCYSFSSHTNQTALLKKRHQLLLSFQLATQYVPLT